MNSCSKETWQLQRALYWQIINCTMYMSTRSDQTRKYRIRTTSSSVTHQSAVVEVNLKPIRKVAIIYRETCMRYRLLTNFPRSHSQMLPVSKFFISTITLYQIKHYEILDVSKTAQSLKFHKMNSDSTYLLFYLMRKSIKHPKWWQNSRVYAFG